VLRLVTRGDGTHRMTLQLHPADLGQVRVTVTVKNGAVDVSLAAAPAAQDALRDGTARLRSLLASSGHTLGQLVLRDLPGTLAAGSQNGAGQGGAGQGGQQQSQGWAQGQAFGQAPQHQGQQAHQQLAQQAGQQAGQWSGDPSPGRDDGAPAPAAQQSASPRRTSSTAAPGATGTRPTGPAGLDVRI